MQRGRHTERRVLCEQQGHALGPTSVRHDVLVAVGTPEDKRPARGVHRERDRRDDTGTDAQGRVLHDTLVVDLSVDERHVLTQDYVFAFDGPVVLYSL